MSDQQSPPADPKDAPKHPVDALVVTHHTLTTVDGDLAYTARTGRIVVREEETKDDVFKGWTARAEMSVPAYTHDDADPAGRPVTFVFNGGPGASSLWLHLGLLGPRVVDAGEPSDPTPPPYALIDNTRTLLRASDLVPRRRRSRLRAVQPGPSPRRSRPAVPPRAADARRARRQRARRGRLRARAAAHRRADRCVSGAVQAAGGRRRWVRPRSRRAVPRRRRARLPGPARLRRDADLAGGAVSPLGNSSR